VRGRSSSAPTTPIGLVISSLNTRSD
jgi:hypothetical protein